MTVRHLVHNYLNEQKKKNQPTWTFFKSTMNQEFINLYFFTCAYVNIWETFYVISVSISMILDSINPSSVTKGEAKIKRLANNVFCYVGF